MEKNIQLESLFHPGGTVSKTYETPAGINYAFSRKRIIVKTDNGIKVYKLAILKEGDKHVFKVCKTITKAQKSFLEKEDGDFIDAFINRTLENTKTI